MPGRRAGASFARIIVGAVVRYYGDHRGIHEASDAAISFANPGAQRPLQAAPMKEVT